jgi:predicted GTPase
VKEYEEQVKIHSNEYLREFGDIPVVATTGSEGMGMKKLMRTAMKVHAAWSKRIDTWVLNSWLKDMLVTMPTARAGDKAVTIKYMTQVKARPPTFALFSNVSELPGFFERFVRSRLQEDFQLEGVPIRFIVKKSIGSSTKLSLLRFGKHSRRGAGLGDSRGKVGPNRNKTRLIKRIRNSILNRRKKDKRVRGKAAHR